MQNINDIVELIFSNPPKPPMSFEITFDFSNGSNLFHFLMAILINGAKKLYGPNIIPSQISKDMFNVLQEYFNSIGYTIKYEYKYADDNITPITADIWFEKYINPIDCHGIIRLL